MRSPTAVHPRVRGEHEPAPAREPVVAGSSPRARGTHALEAQRHAVPRFIPACAGNTAKLGGSAPAKSVHPRVRGEHRLSGLNQSAIDGSSPRARGTRGRARARGAAGRFIPACAGNTFSTPPTPRFTPVHPRVRGEHYSNDQTKQATDGSSPRARGTLLPVACGPYHGRFIPACAGNTASGRLRSLPRAVHPRVRGEHSSPYRNAGTDGGSSPRARGTHQRRARTAAHPRFIPACAGNTPTPRRTDSSRAVHPRVRGEHGVSPSRLEAQVGSSPRARGTRVPQCWPARPSRFIPACAGNT